MAHRKASSEYFDIKGLFRDYASKWYLFVISVIICVGLAFLYSRIKKPVYAVRANIAISTGKQSPLSMLGSLGDVLGNSGYVDDEIFVITSHSLYREVVKNLKLNENHYVRDGFLKSHLEYKDFPVQLFAPEEIADTLGAYLSFKVKVSDKGSVSVTAKANKDEIAEVKDAKFPVTLDTPYGKFVLNKTKHFPDDKGVTTTITLENYNSAAESLAKSIVSDIASRKSNVIQMAIDTPDPEIGMDILNDIIAKYNQRGINEKNLQGELTAEFIDSRLRLLASDLEVAEGNIQNYKQKEGIVDLEAEAQFQSKKKGEVESRLIEAQTEAEIIKMIRDFIADPANSSSLIPLTASSENLRALISTYNEMILKRMDLANNARPNNSALRQLDDQLEAMRKNINTSLDKSYDTQQITVSELRSAKNAADARLGNIPAQERAFRDMLRQQEIKQTLYVFLLQRREETAMILANAVPKGNIIDEAYTLSDPLTMSRKMMLLIAFVIGLMIPPVLIWLRNFLNDKFDSVSAVKKLTDVPVLGEICMDKSGRNLVVTESDTSSTTELFRLMRSNLQFILNGREDKVVLMTSTNSGEGKSFISINLAASLGLLGKKVLLIGMDIRKPRLASYVGVNPRLGLTQYLSSDEISLDQLITPVPGAKNLSVIVAGPVPPNPSEMLMSKRVDDFFAKVREMYDYIIVDSAPVGMVSDTFALDRIADATVYVCRANYTTTRDIDFLNSVYDEKRLKKLSLLVNGTLAKKGYGYGMDGNHKNNR